MDFDEDFNVWCRDWHDVDGSLRGALRLSDLQAQHEEEDEVGAITCEVFMVDREPEVRAAAQAYARQLQRATALDGDGGTGPPGNEVKRFMALEGLPLRSLRSPCAGI